MDFRSKKTLLAIAMNIGTLVAVIWLKNSALVDDMADAVARFPASGAGNGPKKLAPFTTDGCSNWPDGDWQRCCVAHDIPYWRGGTREERAAADRALAECVGEKGRKILGDMMETGTNLGGAPSPLTTYGWGYGWNYTRPYGPLSEEEQRQVQKWWTLTKLPQVILMPPKTTEILTALDRENRKQQISKELKSQLKREPGELYFYQIRATEGRSFQVFDENCPTAYFVISFSFKSDKVLKFSQVGECSIVGTKKR